MIQKAMQLVRKLHQNQTDKAGKPYFCHLTRVAARMEDEFGKAAALLHDSVEDTAYTLEDVERDFGKDMRETIDHLTRRKNEDYFVYVSRLSHDPTARLVKISDLIDNSNLTRLKTVTEEDVERQLKYNRALGFLMTQERIHGKHIPTFEDFQADVKASLMEMKRCAGNESRINEMLQDDFEVMKKGYACLIKGAYDNCKVRSPYESSVYYTAHTYDMLN